MINALPKIPDERYECLGVSVGIDSDYFRPSLWELYESQFPGYFSQHYFVGKNRAALRSSKGRYYRI